MFKYREVGWFCTRNLYTLPKVCTYVLEVFGIASIAIGSQQNDIESSLIAMFFWGALYGFGRSQGDRIERARVQFSKNSVEIKLKAPERIFPSE